jgi:hypothetical protein
VILNEKNTSKNNEEANMYILTKEYDDLKLFPINLKKFSDSSSSFTHIRHIFAALACLPQPGILSLCLVSYSRQALAKFFNNSKRDFEGLASLLHH